MLIYDTTCGVGAMYASWHVYIMVVGHAFEHRCFEQLHRALHCAGSRRTSCTARGRRGCGRIVVAIVSASWPSSLCPRRCGRVEVVVVAIVVAVALCCHGHRCRVILVAVVLSLS